MALTTRRCPAKIVVPSNCPKLGISTNSLNNGVIGAANVPRRPVFSVPKTNSNAPFCSLSFTCTKLKTLNFMHAPMQPGIAEHYAERASGGHVGFAHTFIWEVLEYHGNVLTPRTHMHKPTRTHLHTPTPLACVPWYTIHTSKIASTGTRVHVRVLSLVQASTYVVHVRVPVRMSNR